MSQATTGLAPMADLKLKGVHFDKVSKSGVVLRSPAKEALKVPQQL